MSNIFLNKLNLKTKKFLKNDELPKIDGFHKVYEFNIKELKFNPYNDRFAMEICEYEMENNKKLGFDNESQDYLFKLLSEHKPEANKQTFGDILENGVLKYIVIDNRGIVLDGNRRLFVLRKIVNNPLKYAKVDRDFSLVHALVIDEDNISESRIRDLETSLQISEDEKVEYNPINIYLKIERLWERTTGSHDNAKFSKIATKLGPKYTSNNIKKHHEVYQVMKNYLKYYHSIGRPILLKDRESHFKKISTFNRNIEYKAIETQDTKYYDFEGDYSNARKIYYTLTSVLYEGKAFGEIFPTSKGTGILASKKCIKILLNGLIGLDIVSHTQEKPSTLISKSKMSRVKEIVKNANHSFSNQFPEHTLELLIEKAENDVDKIHIFTLDDARNDITKDAIDRLMNVKNTISKIIRTFKPT